MGFEIERKWIPEKELVSRICSDRVPKRIEQGYLCREPVIRVRKDGDRYYMTYKGKGFECREEYDLPLTEEAYNELLPKHSGNIIVKDRYTVPYHSLFPDQNSTLQGPEGELQIELDVFHDVHEGLVILEVEFDSAESAEKFEAPELFGRDVTGRKEYVNSYLSMKKE